MILFLLPQHSTFSLFTLSFISPFFILHIFLPIFQLIFLFTYSILILSVFYYFILIIIHLHIQLSKTPPLLLHSFISIFSHSFFFIHFLTSFPFFHFIHHFYNQSYPLIILPSSIHFIMLSIKSFIIHAFRLLAISKAWSFVVYKK